MTISSFITGRGSSGFRGTAGKGGSWVSAALIEIMLLPVTFKPLDHFKPRIIKQLNLLPPQPVTRLD